MTTTIRLADRFLRGLALSAVLIGLPAAALACGSRVNSSPAEQAPPSPPQARSGQPQNTPVQPQTPPAQPPVTPEQSQTPPAQPQAPPEQPQTAPEQSVGRDRADFIRASASDRTFMQKAAASDQAAIELAQLAQRKASSDVVKQLAQMIEKDHTTARQALQQLALSRNVVLDPQPTPERQQLARRLDGLDTAAFDLAYVQAVVKEHRKDIAAFEKASTSSDAEVRGFAEKALPALRQHLKQAEAAAAGKPDMKRR